MQNGYSLHKWFKLGLINLVLVAMFGTLMRYKAEFSLPLFNHKFLLHAHSHFAFSGWISHILYTGLALQILPHLSVSKEKKYRNLIILNLIAAYGMLIAFTIQGYKGFSIAFSTLSLIAAFAYTYRYLKDAKELAKETHFKPWAITALLLNTLSAAGPFSIAYLMASKNMSQELMNAAIYLYLHLQYNGWFFFAAMALVIASFPITFKEIKPYFLSLSLTSIPAYLLSILWMELP